MARFIFRLPDIGEGISEAEIVAWHVAIGDRVAEDQQIADMMTDKATVEIESPVAGVIVEVAGVVGDQVPIGSALVVIETAASGTNEAGAAASASTAAASDGATSESADEERFTAENPGAAASATAPDVAPAPAPTTDAPTPTADAAPRGRVLASPAVRARAADLGVDLAQVRADGDRVRHADLDAFLRYGAAQGYQAPAAATSCTDEQVRVIGLRRRIADNMAASKRAIPHFTYVEEIDVTALEAMRADLNADRARRADDPRPRLTLLPLLITAICRSVPDWPIINARYDDEAGVVTRHGAVHLGIATQTPAGLMVPVIRDAQGMNVWQLATAIARLAEAARTGKARSDELSGSTLTITSLGPLGGIATTPVINRPEVAIIAPNRIVERPVFAKNAIGQDEIRRALLMNLSISCDHRVVDGWDAASFVQAVKRLLETPVLLFAG